MYYYKMLNSNENSFKIETSPNGSIHKIGDKKFLILEISNPLENKKCLSVVIKNLSKNENSFTFNVSKTKKNNIEKYISNQYNILYEPENIVNRRFTSQDLYPETRYFEEQTETGIINLPESITRNNLKKKVLHPESISLDETSIPIINKKKVNFQRKVNETLKGFIEEQKKKTKHNSPKKLNEKIATLRREIDLRSTNNNYQKMVKKFDNTKSIINKLRK